MAITTISGRQVLANVVTDAASTGASATIISTYIPNGIVRLTNSSLMSVGGIPAAVGGQFLTIENQTGNTIFINNNDSGASAANRIFTGTGANVAMNANATFNFLYDAVVGMWMISGGTGSGSGGGGSKNYLTPYVASTSSGVANIGNGNFELGSVTGWSLFTTTLTGVIPTGTITAGASSITSFMTISGGTQLSGNYSLSTNVGASYTAGQGFVSNPFFIDASDQAKVLGFSFDYAVESGAGNLNFSGTASNTFAVYIYDVTNAVWIQPAGVYNLVQNSGTGNCNGTFQTSINSTQYQIAVLTINTSAGPANIYWDDFFVGPQIGVNAPAISDWTSYDLVIGSTGTPPTPGTINFNNAVWRRIGDSMEINFQYSQGSGGTAGSGSYTFPLPSGYSIDLTKFANSQVSNAGGAYVSGVDGNGTGFSWVAANGTSLFLDATSSAQANGGLFTVTSTYNGLDNGVNYSFNALVPIVGWSSNSVASNDTDTRVVAAVISGCTSPIDGSTTIFTTVEEDSHGGYNTSTGMYIVPVTGYYEINGQISAFPWSPAAGNYINVEIFQNGTFKRQNIIAPNLTTGQTGVGQFEAVLYCNSGDTLYIQSSTGGFSGASANGVPQNNYISFARKSGPAVITATESVNFKAYLTTNQTLPSNTPIPFDSVIFDSHNAYNPSTGEYTFPVSGTYLVGTVIQVAVGTGDGVYVAATSESNYVAFMPTGQTNPLAAGSIPIKANAGDTVSIRDNTNQTFTGGNQTSYFYVIRTGN